MLLIGYPRPAHIGTYGHSRVSERRVPFGQFVANRRWVGLLDEVDGITQPAPAPRFSRTPAEVSHGARELGADTDETLAAMGFEVQEIAALREAGSIA